MRSVGTIGGMALMLAVAGCASAPKPVKPPPVRPTLPVAAAPTSAANLPITTNLARTAQLSSLAGLVRTSGMAMVLGQRGPFTVFAPSNGAFARLAPGSMERLAQPANRSAAIRLVGYHVVPSVLTSEQIRQQIATGNGYARLQTLAGDTLVASIHSDKIMVQDAAGHRGYITTPDLPQANGRVHVINGVLLPGRL